MSYFIKTPSTMKARHYLNLNIGIVNVIVHALQHYKLIEDDYKFLKLLEDNNTTEYLFVKKIFYLLSSVDLKNELLRYNYVGLAMMLVNNDNAIFKASELLQGLYWQGIILNYYDILKELADPNVKIDSDIALLNELKEKLIIAKEWIRKMTSD